MVIIISGIIIIIGILFVIVFWQDIQSRRSISKYLNSRIDVERPKETYVVIDRPRQNRYNITDNMKERNLKLELETRKNLAVEEKKKELLKKYGVKL